MNVNFGPEDFVLMKRVERAVIDLLLQIEGVNPIIMMFALIRCSRVLLRKGDADAQKMLTPVVVDYLKGKMNATGAPQLLWTPDNPGGDGRVM